MSGEWIRLQHVRDLRGQAVKPVAHANRTAGQIDLGAGRDLDHGAGFSAASTRRSARSLTKGSTRSRVPSTRSISITPGRSSILGRATIARPPAVVAVIATEPACACNPGLASAAGVNTPIG